MKTKDAEILIVPGYTNADEDHWMSRWEANITSARRVEQDDWNKPVFPDWTNSVVNHVEKATKPVILVAHSLGVIAVAHAAPKLTDKVKGAFLVAPIDVNNRDLKPQDLRAFADWPRDPFTFPSVVIGSRNDHYCDGAIADEMAACWGSMFIDAGEAGHINSQSGHGPWPEGLMVFSKFLSRIEA